MIHQIPIDFIVQAFGHLTFYFCTLILSQSYCICSLNIPFFNGQFLISWFLVILKVKYTNKTIEAIMIV